MGFFTHVPLAPPDPILGLNHAFAADARSCKVNLGVGAYKTEDLKPYVLSAVRKAEMMLVEEGLYKEYLPIEGERSFLSQIIPLVLGDEAPLDHLFVAQSLGGTGALRTAAQFLVEQTPGMIYIPTPTWDNHARVFGRAGLTVASYPYYDAVKKEVNFSALYQSLLEIPSGSIIVLHACCHNPSGSDLTFEQWKELCTLFQRKGLLPFFDFAYQGFGKDLDSDAQPIRYFVKHGVECFIAVSFSKNFGLYGERVGALFSVCHDRKSAQAVSTQMKVAIRSLYSNPPLHGARIVSTILQDTSLRHLWISELTEMRERIQKMRHAFADQLKAEGSNAFEFIRKQTGMFAYTGISAVAVEQLKEKYAIYLPRDGRVSLAGLNEKTLSYVTDAFIAVNR